MVNHKYSLVGYYSEDTQQLLLVQDTNFVDNSFELVELVVHPALASLFVLVMVVALVVVVGAHVMTLAISKFVTIRTSSYRLGQEIFIGCYVIAVSFLCFTTYKVATTDFGEYHFGQHHSGLDTSPGSDPHSWHAHCQNLETLSNILPLEKARKIPTGQGSDSRSSGTGWHRCDPMLSLDYRIQILHDSSRTLY